jgi:ankyrin repeat protein
VAVGLRGRMKTKHGLIVVICVLLEHGANVGAKDKQGRTPFLLAKEHGYDEIMKLLSERGAE